MCSMLRSPLTQWYVQRLVTHRLSCIGDPKTLCPSILESCWRLICVWQLGELPAFNFKLSFSSRGLQFGGAFASGLHVTYANKGLVFGSGRSLSLGALMLAYALVHGGRRSCSAMDFSLF